MIEQEVKGVPGVISESDLYDDINIIYNYI